MSFGEYAITVNLALALTILSLVLVKSLLTFCRINVTARTETSVLRLTLVAVIAMPIAFMMLEKSSGVAMAPIKIVAQPDDYLGAYLVHVSDYLSDQNGIHLLFVLLAGAGVMLVLIDILKLFHLSASSIPLRQHGRVTIRIGAPHTPPCAYVHPWGVTVIMPAGLMKQDQKCAFIHEITHIRRGDLVWNWIASFAAIIFVCNPAFWCWRCYHTHISEIACDNDALDRHITSRSAYAESLLRISSAIRQNLHATNLAAPFGNRSRFRKTALRNRIERAISGEKINQSRFAGFALLLAVLSCNITLNNIDLSARSWSVQRLEQSTNTNLKRMKSNEFLRPFGLVLAI
jgi:beta-lactamase regulating signal transducer with metallopeptidase domain